MLRLASVVSLTQHPKTFYDAVVVGAGHNGLACAALLAKAGRSVAVFERRDALGGAAVSERDVWPGFTLSTASYVCSLLDPWLVEELGLHDRGLSYYRKDPYAFTPLLDGRSLLLGTDRESNAREIAAFEPRDVAGFAAYVERTDRLGRALFDSFSDDEPQFDRFDAETQAALRGSAAELVERYISTPVLQAELVNDGLIGTYLGPRDPGTGYVLAHHLAGRLLGTQGSWAFVRGGMGSVSRALATAATAHGAEIFAGTDSRGSRSKTIAPAAPAEHVGNDTRRCGHLECASANDVPRSACAGCARSGVRRSRRNWRSVGPSLKVNLALGELPDFTVPPGNESAIAPSCDHSRRSDD